MVQPKAVFGRLAPAILEIGFGRGEALLGMARLRPEADFLGIEVHRPGIAAALQALAAALLPNVRIMRGDALELLSRQLAPATLDEVCIFFPDPWPRAGDHARRIVRPWLRELLQRTLRPGGVLRVATDVPEYAAHTHALMTVDGWEPTCLPGGSVQRPSTVYERKGLEAGRPVVDLCFRHGPALASPVSLSGKGGDPLASPVRAVGT